MIGDRKSYIALGGIVLSIVVGELLSSHVLSRQVVPTTSFNPVGLATPIPSGPPTNLRRLPAGYSPLGDPQIFGKSELTIENGTDLDALVKVMMLIDGRPSLVRNFYVPAQTNWTEQSMPKGSFILRIAHGLDFDLQGRRFTARRSFAESMPFDLLEREWTEQNDGRTYRKTSFSRKRITLHKVINGNFHTEPIDEARFGR